MVLSDRPIPARRATTRHLMTAQQLAPLEAPLSGVDPGDLTRLTRMPGQGNGVRVHGVYIVAVSLCVLLTFFALIAIASGHM